MPGHYSINRATVSAWALRLANALSLAQAGDSLPPCHWFADSKLSIALILAVCRPIPDDLEDGREQELIMSL